MNLCSNSFFINAHLECHRVNEIIRVRNVNILTSNSDSIYSDMGKSRRKKVNVCQSEINDAGSNELVHTAQAPLTETYEQTPATKIPLFCE